MTRILTLRNRFQGNSTIVENDFIDHYMAKANGEYVKVYLLLLRHLSAGSPLSISALADCLECTEKDILRAFKHWSKVGLLKIDYDEAGNICGLAIGQASSNQESEVFVSSPVVEQPKNSETATEQSGNKKVSSPIKAAKKQPSSSQEDELRQLYFVVEQYMGKPLTVTEIKKLNYFFDTLGFSVDLIEYLVEYCVENGHRNFRYIESVALSWSVSGITTVDEAMLNTSLHNKNCYPILNAFGIKGRGPAPAELEFIKRWTEEFGFTLDVILEACNRTITNTHKPDFKYTDSILNNWFTNGVKHLTDVSRLDQEFKQGKESKKRSASASVTTNNRFNNFEGRSYDMTSLEQQLLNTN